MPQIHFSDPQEKPTQAKIRLIREGKIQEYFVHPWVYLPFIWLTWFLIFSIDQDWKSALLTSGIISIVVILLLASIIFLSQEILERRRWLRQLQHPQFECLQTMGLQLHPDLYYTGTYDGYSFRIRGYEETIGKRKKRLVFSCSSYFHFPEQIQSPEERDAIRKQLAGEYSIGRIFLGAEHLVFQPRNPFYANWEQALLYLVNLMRENKLRPMDYGDWFARYVQPDLDWQEKDKKERTVYLINLGKWFNVSYLKPEKKTEH
ncbi:hypothetical protein [Mangrovibacterium diazotrophicum]|uniref:Uncharacterized protein n=1 Tax=Mangrovibacterium diazotrophicum TaxID=1261403 RepID=A0A419VUB9_9BACT|nr:hypothetical protein [Mangrovibacterium diazotrophicum]RKD85075.1 hypothetical protein BC643_4594 [Mangrovibacterium diazotrophicum]